MDCEADLRPGVGCMIVLLCMVLCISACASHKPARAQNSQTPTDTQTEGSKSAIWTELLQKSPFPHTAPLPPQKPTVLDGTYVKFDPKKTPPVPCRRCPDYLPEGGIWKLQLSKGVFRIFHEFTGWRSIGSFVVEKNQVRLFNDPTCIEVTGLYTWALKAGQLTWVALQDECAIGLRATNLMKLPWMSCQPPTIEAGFNGHWNMPPGCD